MNETSERNFMELVGLGKGKGFAHKARHTLAQGVVPAFDMDGFAGVFANRVEGY